MAAAGDFSPFRPHPWHGLSTGQSPPSLLRAFIEVTPSDTMKYEIDKQSGYMRLDRPQRSSSLPPTPYGFVPRTYCGARVCALSPTSTKGDEDPLDICVIAEQPIDRGEVLLDARVVGVVQMIDGGEADDKIIAVLVSDPVYGAVTDVSELPKAVVARLVHYFSSYKSMPGETNKVVIGGTFGRARAETVVRAAMEDYDALIATLSH
ncbi:MAG: inorganic pyrophosphatase [Phycisphaerales bacterium]|nr:inorganic pyrophosphatase [Phycisphaerales bacterium]